MIRKGSSRHASPDSDSSCEKAEPRRKLRRESAVEAKKKLQLQQQSPGKSRKDSLLNGGGGQSSNGGSSGSSDAANNPDSFCDRGCCTEIFPGCCAEISESCLHDKVKDVSKWVHISDGEHLCQACYDEFSKPGKAYSESFRKWKMAWSLKSRREPMQRLYAAEELLPFWLQCRKCEKWRWLKRESLDPSFIRAFHCGLVDKKSFIDEKLVFVQINMCSFSQDSRVQQAKESDWVRNLTVPGLLWSSPANYFLNNEYFDDEVGMSPTHVLGDRTLIRDECLESVMEPFYVPTEPCRALCLRPDVMEYDEILEFSEYVTEQAMYLGLRNLIVTLWNMNPKPPRVVVIGAGISGLGVARQLSNFGYDVTVLEAKNKIGGRIRDDWTLGVSVGKGAQLVTGVLNNPIIVMCHQRGVPYRPVTEECPLLDMETGAVADTTSDKRVDFHFNCLLDALADWKMKSEDSEDHSLQEFLTHVHNGFLKDSKLKWTEEEERLLAFQLGNLEFSCGACLKDVSARHFDQNEHFAQFAGDHALLTDGGAELCKQLAKGLDILRSHKVVRVDYVSGKRAVVHTRNGKKFACDKVVVALPLAVLQQENIAFCPELPMQKKVAVRSLGAGIIEKVAVKFPKKFWAERINGADYFGHVPSSKEDRGLFNMFYDFSTGDSKSKQQSYVLMSYVCGEAVDIVNQESDQSIVKRFLKVLEKLFPEEEIPEPEGQIITRWAKDTSIGMSYSYVRTGSTGKDYDSMAETVSSRIFFAGEATNRHFPQTITGAYLSGLREAGKIVAES